MPVFCLVYVAFDPLKNYLTPAPFSRSSRKAAKKTRKKGFDLLSVFAS
jgi:hypothetical protein